MGDTRNEVLLGVAEGFAGGFWSAFEKSRADMKDRVQKREAQDRIATIRKEMNDKFVYEQARLEGENNAFRERVLRNPKSISPEERNQHEVSMFVREQDLLKGKLDYLSPLLVDENPYISKLAESEAKSVVAVFEGKAKKIEQSYVRAMEARAQDSEISLRDAQAGLAEAGAEQTAAQVDEMPDRLALERRQVGAQETAAGAAASQARTAERSESRAGYESLVKTDLEKGRQALEAKKLEIEERGLGARTAQARAELVQTVMGLDLEDQQVEELLKDTGIDTKNLKTRWKGVSQGMRDKFKSLKEFRDGLAEKAEKGDKKAAQRVGAVESQMAGFSNLLDDLQMFELEEANFDATASPLQKFLKLISTDIGEDGPARNYYYNLWFADDEEGGEK